MDSEDSSSDSTTSDSDSLYDNRSRQWNREGNKCLFCVKIMDNVVDALNHCKIDHNFDVFEMVEKFNMNRAEYTQFICFIRSKKPDPSEICRYSECWKKTNCTRVHVKNDLWLINDIVGLKSKCDDPTPKYVNSESGKVVMFVHHFLELQKRLQELSDKVKEMGREINDAQERYFESQPPGEASSRSGNIACSWQSELHCARDHVSTFGSALASSFHLSGKRVLVTGWGSTSLALLALDAEARSATILPRDHGETLLARQVVAENGLSERISILQLDQSPSDQFDVVLSDWMGHFLFFENKLNSVLFARDNLLSPNGVIVPSKFTISMFGISDENSPIDVSLANYNITPLIKQELTEPRREAVTTASIITDTALVYTMDLVTFSASEIYFETDFVLECQREALLTALGGYFEAFVDDRQTSPVVSTSPQAQTSRWKQTVFHLKRKEPCSVGTRLNCRVRCLKNPRNNNGFMIHLSVNGNDHSYEFPVAYSLTM